MMKDLRKKALYYFVVGWKTDSVRGSVVAFAKSNSATPGSDVEKALSLGCSSVSVRLAEGADAEREQRDYMTKLSGPGIQDYKTGRSFDPPLKDGVLTYNIIGWAPTGEVIPPTGKQTNRNTFAQNVSVTPAYDVEQALRSGSTSVFVEINYEPSEDEIREREEDKRRAEEAEKKFQELGKRTFHRGELIRSYCVYDKRRVEMKNPRQSRSKDDLPMIEGICASCGRQVYMIGRIE
jgi:hypothetical protein